MHRKTKLVFTSRTKKSSKPNERKAVKCTAVFPLYFVWFFKIFSLYRSSKPSRHEFGLQKITDEPKFPTIELSHTNVQVESQSIQNGEPRRKVPTNVRDF